MQSSTGTTPAPTSVSSAPVAVILSLCGAHHRIVHSLGYLITAIDGGRFSFTRANGSPVPASPPLPEPGGDLATLIDTDVQSPEHHPDRTRRQVRPRSVHLGLLRQRQSRR
jgi:hypothetical protein